MNFEIDASRFNNNALIDSRVDQCQQCDQGALRTALSYLYLDDGPVNLPRARRVAAELHLDLTERIVIRWLATRTNGNLRKTYGGGALLAARSKQYRCESCGYSDVRALNIDHISGKADPDTAFACLCANCHAIKSREKDWSGASTRYAATTT